MLKSLKILVYFLFFLSSNLVFSQSLDGLQEIVKLQQDKISSIEDNLKKLIGSIEEQSNLNKSIANSKLIENQINDINQKLRLLESNIKNINLLKKYVSDNGKIISSKITSVSYNKQRKLTREIKKAKILGLI